MELAALDRLAQRLGRREQMTLTHELLEGSRTHPIGERSPELCDLPRAHDGSRESPKMRSAHTAQCLSPTPSRMNATAMPVASA